MKVQLKLWVTLIFTSILFFWGCTLKNENTKTSDSLKNAAIADDRFLLKDIWQLDYYPDSILIHKSINKYSSWSAPYAYNIKFAGDSGYFVGCHESWWQKLTKVNDSLYRQGGDDKHYFDIELRSDNKLFLKEIYNGKIFGHYPYHKVSKILTLDSLERRIAKDVFAGSYEVLFSDTLKCNPIITLDGFNVMGIEGIKQFEISAEDDWDFPLENYFQFKDGNNKTVKSFSFQFSSDTLRLINWRVVSGGDGGVPEILSPAIVMRKIK